MILTWLYWVRINLYVIYSVCEKCLYKEHCLQHVSRSCVNFPVHLHLFNHFLRLRDRVAVKRQQYAFHMSKVQRRKDKDKTKTVWPRQSLIATSQNVKSLKKKWLQEYFPSSSLISFPEFLSYVCNLLIARDKYIFYPFHWCWSFIIWYFVFLVLGAVKGRI